ncbi:MAG: hypothetical protein V4858_07010 [Pseudomonadota bacterium]
MRFFCITHTSLQATNNALTAACRRLDIAVILVSPDSYALHPRLVPVPGDLLYRAATDAASVRLEQALWQSGVAAFYDDPYGDGLDPKAQLLRHGVPTVQGAESLAHGETLRLVIVGDHVVATGTHSRLQSDRRILATTMAGNSILAASMPSPEAVALALKATRAMRIEFAGVDLRDDEAGRPVVAALHFPCDFADLQHSSGVDIAGAMVDHLVVKHCKGKIQAKNPYARLNPDTKPISAPQQALEPMLIQQWRPSGM